MGLQRVGHDWMANSINLGKLYKLGQTPRDGEGQEGLVCCSPWGHEELDMTGQLNNSNNSINFLLDLWFYAIFIFCAFIELNELNCVIITGKKTTPEKKSCGHLDKCRKSSW